MCRLEEHSNETKTKMLLHRQHHPVHEGCPSIPVWQMYRAFYSSQDYHVLCRTQCAFPLRTQQRPHIVFWQSMAARLRPQWRQYTGLAAVLLVVVSSVVVYSVALLFAKYSASVVVSAVVVSSVAVPCKWPWRAQWACPCWPQHRPHMALPQSKAARLLQWGHCGGPSVSSAAVVVASSSPGKSVEYVVSASVVVSLCITFR